MGQKSFLTIVVIGRIGAPFGIKGWVHLQSFTDPPENILTYPKWQVSRGPQQNWESKTVIGAKAHGKQFIALLEGCENREQAQGYTNAELGVYREELPDLASGTHYWTDLIGLAVVNEQGICLGKVDHLFETGANDVLVVRGGSKEHLIPYVPEEYILAIDTANRTIKVHWDPEF